MLTIYGIPNCDTCRKARKWLDAAGVDYVFHDVRQDGLDRASVSGWEKLVGWQKILNTRSTTWRGLSAADKADVDASKAVQLILSHPTLLKRPVAADDDSVVIGFSPESYAALRR